MGITHSAYTLNKEHLFSCLPISAGRSADEISNDLSILIKNSLGNLTEAGSSYLDDIGFDGEWLEDVSEASFGCFVWAALAGSIQQRTMMPARSFMLFEYLSRSSAFIQESDSVILLGNSLQGLLSQGSDIMLNHLQALRRSPSWLSCDEAQRLQREFITLRERFVPLSSNLESAVAAVKEKLWATDLKPEELVCGMFDDLLNRCMAATQHSAALILTNDVLTHIYS